MEFIIDLLQTEFALGLSLGLLITCFIWKSGFSTRRLLKKEIMRVENESKELQKHLNTHLKVQAEGSDAMNGQLVALKEQNETLRVNIATLQQKPGKAEIRHLHVIDSAISIMREQAPGFAPAWEKALRKAEVDYADSEGGLKKLIRKVLPSIATPSATEEGDQDTCSGSH